MITDGAGGILLTDDVSVDIDGPTLLSKSLTSVLSIAATLSGDVKSAGDALTSLHEAAGSISVNKPLGTQLWEVVIRASSWALGSLLTRDATRSQRQALVKSITQIGTDLENNGALSVDRDFFSNPSNNSFYRVIRDQLSDNRSLFRDVNETLVEFQARFDVLFNEGVFELLSRNATLLSDASRILNSPLSAAQRHEADWNRYRAQIRYDFQGKAVFGQEDTSISLSQLYVPLRCVWTERDSDEAVTNNPKHLVDPKRSVRFLDSVLKAWLNDKQASNVFLIGGGPGSGKSTSVRYIADWMSSNPSLRPLYVPLQHINPRDDLRDALNRYFCGKDLVRFESSPLEQAETVSGTCVIIFDGLDELAQPGEAADQVTSQFIIKLINLLSTLPGGKDQFCAIVTGRLPSFQNAQRHLALPVGQSVEVVGYASLQQHDYGYSSRVDDPEGLIRIDQRQQWWEKYATLVGLDRKLPAAMSEQSLLGITNEPLLCYLLVLADFVGANWEEAADNKNRIYEKLINDVWQRGWGEGRASAKRQGPGKTLTQSDFVKLMETIALAAWLGGDTRICTEENFKRAVEFTSAQRAWDAFRRDNGEDVTNLAMNFYLKSSEIAYRGFEFTHKSFGEYLTARALLSLGACVGVAPPSLLPLMTNSWIEWTGSGIITSEILDFLKSEARLEVDDRAQRDRAIQIKNSLTTLLHIACTRGLAPAPHKFDNWLKGESIEKDGQVALWSVIHSIAHAFYVAGDAQEYRIQLNIDRPDTLGRAIHRLVEHRDGVILRYLLGLNLSGEICIGWNGRADLRGTVLTDTIFHACSFWSSDFSSAMWEKTHISNSHFMRCEFGNASINNPTVTWSSFSRSNFWEHVHGVVRTDSASLLVGEAIPGDYTLLNDVMYRSESLPAEQMIKRYGRMKPLVNDLSSDRKRQAKESP